jgi:hypothetical protein
MLFASYDNRHDTVVALKDQVMQIGGSDRPQSWEFGRGIGIAEDVEGPNPHGSAAQVRVVETAPEECLQGNGRDTCSGQLSVQTAVTSPSGDLETPPAATAPLANRWASFISPSACRA